MSTTQEPVEWLVFGPAFWDEDTLIARASDGLWVYPGGGFYPEHGQYYYLTLKKKVSQRTQRPYYVGYPRHGGVVEPPQEFKQLLGRIQNLENEIKAIKTERAELLEEMAGLQEENTDLREEIMALRFRLLRQDRSESEGDDFLLPNQKTIEKMLKNCSLEDLLGNHPQEKQKTVYRKLMQLIHPDKTRDFGEKTILILEELVKIINARYHRR